MNYIIGEESLIELKHYTFDCHLQNIASICNLYSKEFYKILYNEEIFIDTDGNSREKYKCRIRNQYEYNMEKYYGIKLIEIDEFRNIELDNNYIYQVIFDIKRYPLCQNIQSDDIKVHMATLYDICSDKFLIFDNFYRVSKLELTEDEFKSSMIKIYRIEKKEINLDNYKLKKEMIITITSSNFKYIYEEIYSVIKDSQLDSLNEKILMNNIQFIGSHLSRKNYLIKELYGYDEFINVACMLLEELIERIRAKWYQLAKYKIRNGTVTKDEFLKKYHDLNHILEVINKIYNEIKNIILIESNLKEKLIEQINKYLGDEADLEENVYKKHDGYTILELVNFLEAQNSLNDINPLVFTGKLTYKEFILELYKYILLE